MKPPKTIKNRQKWPRGSVRPRYLDFDADMRPFGYGGN